MHLIMSVHQIMRFSAYPQTILLYATNASMRALTSGIAIQEAEYTLESIACGHHLVDSFLFVLKGECVIKIDQAELLSS